MITREELTSIGKFGKPHGIAGEVNALITAPDEVLSHCSCIICDIDGIFVPFFITNIRSKSTNSLLLNIDGINSESEASMLVNKDIYVLQREYNEILDDDEVPVDFFINYDAVINDELHGKIVDIDDSTANVLFIVTLNDDRQVLIPAVDEFIQDYDNESRSIHFRIPQELLEL